MRIHRADKYIQEAIDALDLRLKEAKGSIPTAFTLLSKEEVEFVAAEIAHCIDSRVYYLTNYHVIATERGQLMGMDPLWDHQWMVEQAIQDQRDVTGQSWVIVLKPRQAGVSEYANGVMCHNTFFTPHAYTMTVAQDLKVAAHMQRKVNIAWTYLPWWMRPERQYHEKGEYLEFGRSDVATSLIDPGLGSVFVTTHAQRASGVAIGRTIRFLHLTEVSRWPSGEIYTADIEPSMNAPDTNAICESTALGDGFFKNMWDEAVEGESDWKPVFLPAYRAKKYSLPLLPSQRPFFLTDVERATRDRVQEEENFFVTDEFFNWRRRRIKSAIKRTGFPYAHFESYPITPKEAFQSSGRCAFPRHKLDEQSQMCVRRPRWVGEIGFMGMNAVPKLLLNDIKPGMALEKREYENRLYIWKKPEPNKTYYASWDVGSSGGGDFNVGQIICAGTGNEPDEQVAEWVGYEQPVALGKIAYALGFYYNKAETAVEYAKEGMITANSLANDLEYPNIYRPRALDKVGKQLMNYLHWQTTRKSKALCVGVMSEALIERQIIIRSQYCVDQMYKFVKWGLGYEGLGSNDDACMALIIGLFCLRQTMPELRAPNQQPDANEQSPTRGARLGIGAVVYGLYDEYFRLRGQTQSLQRAQDAVNANPAWSIKPIPVTRANTAYSPIHHGNGPENQLLRQGVDSWDITPSLITTWRSAQLGDENRAEEFNTLAQGEEWGRD